MNEDLPNDFMGLVKEMNSMLYKGDQVFMDKNQEFDIDRAKKILVRIVKAHRNELHEIVEEIDE